MGLLRPNVVSTDRERGRHGTLYVLADLWVGVVGVTAQSTPQRYYPNGYAAQAMAYECGLDPRLVECRHREQRAVAIGLLEVLEDRGQDLRR